MGEVSVLKVLVVEDDPQQAELLVAFLEARNYDVQLAPDGETALTWEGDPDFVLLDLNLPDVEGIRLFPLLKQRHPHAFFVMLTARREEIDRVIGLEMGADDYITKPYSLREVDARLRAIFRRHHSPEPAAPLPAAPEPAAPPPTAMESLHLDASRCVASCQGREVDLTAQEFRVLEFLVRRPRQIFSRGQLIDAVWQEGLYVTDRVVDAMIARIRKKLRACTDRDLLHTKHGLGYAYDDPS